MIKQWHSKGFQSDDLNMNQEKNSTVIQTNSSSPKLDISKITPPEFTIPTTPPIIPKLSSNMPGDVVQSENKEKM